MMARYPTLKPLRAAMALALGTVMLLPTAPAQAALETVSQRTEIDYWIGSDGDEGRLDLSRLSLGQSFRLRAGEHWDIDLAGRFEAARDRTGLGTTRSYSPLSRPLIDSDRARLEIDRLVISRRFGDQHLSLGKQTIAWGVLDGIQITDRFDPIRRRDFVLTELRPERISRWGLRWRHGGGGLRADLAVAFDPTVNQFAQVGDRFEPLAPRLRGGLPAELASDSVNIVQSERDRYWRDATAGLRLSHSIGRADASLLILSGPDTEPLLRLSNSDALTPTIRLDYPRRQLLGATLEMPAGSQVWRVELAHIPNQSVNTVSTATLSDDRRSRSLAGLGLDWNAPAGWFVNTQLAVDHLGSGQPDAVRPRTDVIATLRAQRGFVQDSLKLRLEALGSLSDGDGVVRASLDWQISDRLRGAIGADGVFGSREGLFGQYRDQSQLWTRLRFSW